MWLLMDGSCAWRVSGMFESFGLKTYRGELVEIERTKGIRWMPWHQEATKDVARCEKSWGTASRF